MKDWSRRELLSSAVCAAIGLMFAYAAVFGEQRHVPYQSLDKLACALGFFANAPGRGVPVLLSMLAAALLALTGIMWLLAPSR